MANHREAIDELGQQIRAHYVLRRGIHLRLLQETAALDNADRLAARWDGGTDSRGSQHKPVWPKLAKRALKDGLDPRLWVDALFSLTYLFNHVPRPTDLENHQVVSRVREWPKHCRQDVMAKTEAEWLVVLREQFQREDGKSHDPRRVARTIVADPRLELSSLVRYLFALRYDHLDLAELLETLAAIQYAAMPEVYEAALRGKIPDSLRQAATLQQDEGVVYGRN